MPGGFGRLELKQDEPGYDQGKEGKKKGVVPTIKGQGAADGGIAGRADGEHTGVVAHGGRAGPALEQVADHRGGQGGQGGASHPLEEPQEQQEIEIPDQTARTAGDGEENQGRDEDPLPAEAVRQNPQER